ncbi:circularly permuted type 2 ATP-grasp protein [Oricola sp.]|uniref:circularly permuted type 2 ATP-grasp protein n=1 Tax=Oricola sp. TaxID=1979950 RepID=UPI00351787FE
MNMQGEPLPDSPTGRLLSGYSRLDDVPDELIGADGRIRPVWHDLIQAIAAMSEEELSARMARGDQYLRDAGVFYRHYGPQDTTERDWPLSHMPLLIDETEWNVIADGLVQRADLLERIIADLYGPNSLVADGHLPAPLIANNREWLRPLVGVTPRSGHFLHFLAFDLGRGPDGNWWVLGDRTQAPSGAGFALENRIATSRIFSDTYGRSNVERLAGFFRDFRDRLLALRENEEGRVGILTPGPLNDTYFEHAYIARYLGFMLLEGEDLTVRNGRLMVRTIDGLSPVSVLWRRLDSAWADPLELNDNSRLGTPGMVGAVRNGSVTMINALGSGVLETRAFLAFVPRICEAMTGESLKIPNIATWWCGQPREREHVKANAQKMTIGDAFATRLPFDLDDISVVGGTVGEHRNAVDNWIDTSAAHLVGQEVVTLSTAPAFVDGALAPRPMSLRVFLARTADGWRVMPGGFARIGRSGDTPELAMQRGGSVADVWVVRKSAVDRETTLAPSAAPFVRNQPGVLPSRAADNLYWLGRYVERAETMIRLTRAYHLRLAETAWPDTPLLSDLADYLKLLGIEPEDAIPEGISAAIASASASAGHVRDRFSLDGWLALSDIEKTIRNMARTATPGDDMARAMGVLLRKLSGFSGLVHENMYRFNGWRFLSIGRSLERAIAITYVLARFADPDAPEGALDLAVEVGDSAMSHRRRYAVATNRETVIDLLALDPLNPRSVVHQFDKLQEHFGFLPGAERHRPTTELQRAMLKTHAALSVHTAGSLDTAALLNLGAEIGQLSEEIRKAYFR